MTWEQTELMDPHHTVEDNRGWFDSPFYQLSRFAIFKDGGFSIV